MAADQKQKSQETKKKLFRTKKRPFGPNYKRVVKDHARTTRSYKRKRATIDRLYAPGEAKSSALERAQEVQSNLDPEFLSVVKSMLRSHVTAGFWLGLPSQFCELHLPKQDAPITLVDENGDEYQTKYLAEKKGLSGGWRGFSIAHKLLEGDVLVFQLVKATRFKVYIVRANGLDEVDGALCLLNLDACAKRNDAGKDNGGAGINISRKAEGKRSQSLPLAAFQKNNQKTSMPLSVAKLGLPTGEQSENDSEEVDSEVLEGIRFSGSNVEFKDVKNIENFNILVNGLIIDSELSKHLKTKYYELCFSQKAFLHAQLLEGINCKLVAGIISETVNIADAIRASKLTTSQDEFSIWDKSLKAFEQLGMDVGFLRARLQQVVSLACESEEALDSKRYREARFERARVEEEMRTLEMKLMELKEASERLDAEIGTLKVKAESHELKFQEEVNAAW
ncbi:hypothetical protein HHK36_031560 [Tetracentron sinense]|uniref:TF-B3 domain-containing protein n=1 Tax=Tetracentron sinense TaxID=13715 RepID=A0A834Y8Y4_TETSI|nr:hypothetical protein HHK36_031560 [Tetracentron sinense]